MTPLEKLEELGTVCIRFSCRILHNFLLRFAVLHCSHRRDPDRFANGRPGLEVSGDRFQCPGEGEVGDLFPPFLAQQEVPAVWELLVRSDGV